MAQIMILNDDELEFNKKTLPSMISTMTPSLLSATAAAVLSEPFGYIDDTEDEDFLEDSDDDDGGDLGSMKSVPLTCIQFPTQPSPLAPSVATNTNTNNYNRTVGLPSWKSISKPPTTITTITTSIPFQIKIKFDLIRLSWHELNSHRHHNEETRYQLFAFLLKDDDDEESNENNDYDDHHNHSHNHHQNHNKNKPKYRKNREKLLTKEPIVNRRIQTLEIEDSITTRLSLVTEIFFDQQQIEFECEIRLETNRPIFRSQVLRIELQQLRLSSDSIIPANLNASTSIGFVDFDLANCLNVDHSSQEFTLPMILFSDYHEHLIQCCSRPIIPGGFRHNFCFEINVKMEGTPRLLIGNPCCNNNNNRRRNPFPDPVYNGIEQFRRIDSLPDLSNDRELKYHESPPFSRYNHLLNIFGVLPPGHLYRISIHFGHVEHLLLPQHIPSVSACFEVKQSRRLNHPLSALFHPHYNRHHHNRHHHDRQYDAVCCRTKQLSSQPGQSVGGESDCGYFDQYFTFFERFYFSDSPKTCLSIINDQTGKQLYRFKSTLSEYVNCRSVRQFFYLTTGKDDDDYCMLQFSIVVKKID